MEAIQGREPGYGSEASMGSMSTFSLRFAPTIEEHFKRDRDTVWRRQALFDGWIGFFLYDSFVWGDYWVDPALLWRSLVVRFMLFTPLALVCLWAMSKVCGRELRDAFKLAIIVLGAAGALTILSESSKVSAAIGQGYFLCIVFGVLVMRMSMPLAAATNLILLVEEGIFLWRQHPLTWGESTTCFFLVVTCIGGSLLANHRLERSERNSYRLLLQADEQRQKLEVLNRSLEELSSQDGLTGLANRRRFDEHGLRAGAAAWNRELPVSMVMADIDHFKCFNDSYGHLAGDSVLKQVSAILRLSMRGGDDLAARFGGEEFVLFLPDADQQEAALVAHRVVEAVSKEAFLLPGSDRPVKVTISCGVATGWSASRATNSDLSDLIARSDAALYEAKRTGRNRVCCQELELAMNATG